MASLKTEPELDDGASTVSKPAAVNVVKISKDGLFVNNFIATRTAAVQQESDDEGHLHLPIERKYLKRISKERIRKEKRYQQVKHRSVQRKDVSDRMSGVRSAYSENLLKQILQSLVNLVRPTEVVRFLTTLKQASINDSKIETSEIFPQHLDQHGEVITEALSDICVAVVSNSQSGTEESAILLLKQEPIEEKPPEEAAETRRSKSSKEVDVLTELEQDSLEQLHSSVMLKKSSLQLLPDTPAEIISVASRLMRSKTDRGPRAIERTRKQTAKLQVLCVLQILPDTRISLEGGGEVAIVSCGTSLGIGTVSVRSMWGFVMALQRARLLAREGNIYKQKLSHAWVTMYFDDHTTVPKQSVIGDVDKERETLADLDNDGEEDLLMEKEDVDVEEILFRQSYMNMADDLSNSQSSLPRKRDLMASIKKILVQYDIDDIAMDEIYKGLEEIYGPDIFAENGLPKALVDTMTITAVGQVDPPSKIMDGLFLGSEYNASNKQELDELGIKLIVNVTEEVENFFPKYYRYHKISLKDVPSADLKAHFKDAIQAMKEAREKDENILVHCQRGVSRSASVVIAYLMEITGDSLEDTLSYVKKKRSIVKPNPGFKEQLEAFEVELREEKAD